MKEFVTTCDLTCNGEKIDDFKTFTEDARVLRKAINLMKTTGRAKVTPRYGFSLDYVVPANGAEFDFDSVEDGTFTVEYDGGERVTFGDVSVTEVGESKADEENEMVRTIKFIAGSRIKE